jgi:two-component system NtrC family sensor kinase
MEVADRWRTKWRYVAAVLAVALVPAVALWVMGRPSAIAAGAVMAAAALSAYLLGLGLAGQGRDHRTVERKPVPESSSHSSGGSDRELEALKQIARAIELMTEPAQFYRWLTERLAVLLDAEKCALILRLSAGEGAFRVVVPAYGLSQDETEALSARVLAIGRSPRGMQELLVCNQGQPSGWAGPLPGERNFMLVPLLSGDEPVGAIRISNGRHGFSDDDVQLVRFLADWLAGSLQNTQRYQALQDRLEEMSLLYSVGVPLSGTLDFDEAVSRAIQAIQSTLDSDLVTLFLVDESSETLHLHDSVTSQVPGGPEIRVPLGEGIIGQAAETGEIMRSTDVQGDPLLLPLSSQVRSELSVPLKLGSWVIGVVYAQSSQPDAFEDKDVRLLDVVAAQLATLLQSARLYEATRQRAAELSLLYDATVAISTAELDRDGITELLMKRLTAAISVDWGQLCLLDNTTRRLVTRYVHGREVSAGLACSPDGSAVEDYLLRSLLTYRKPLTIYDNDPSLEAAVAASMKAHEIRSALVLPLLTHDRVIGLVELVHKTPHRFTSEEVRLALTLATQASIAMENARLFQETKLAVEDLAALQALALDITAQVSLPELLDRLMMRARHLVKAAGSVIYLIDPQEAELMPVASDLAQDARKALIDRAGFSLAQRVMADGRSLAGSLEPDSVALGERRGTPASLEKGGVSFACVPLRWHEQVVGVLCAFRAEHEPPFEAQQMYLLELLAPQAAIAIRNVQLFEALERGMRDLEQAQTSLIQAEKAAAIGRLAASLAHEINNPLQSLNNCLHLSLRSDVPSNRRGMYLSLAQGEVERLIAIVNRMLNFYRPSTGETRSETSINQLLDDVLVLVDKQLEHTEIDVNLDLDPDLPTILAVPNDLRQVFLNLILNAVDAMPEGGRLDIATRQLGDSQVGVTISDTGRGIPEEHLSRIYEPFFTTKERGTGLGLSISYGIVKTLRGTIQVESAVGIGTTFTLQFPRGVMEGE